MRSAPSVEYRLPTITDFGSLHEMTASSVLDGAVHCAQISPGLSGVGTPPPGGTPTPTPTPGGGTTPGGPTPGGTTPIGDVAGQNASGGSHVNGTSPVSPVGSSPFGSTSPNTGDVLGTNASGTQPGTAGGVAGGSAVVNTSNGAGTGQLPFTGARVGLFGAVGAALAGTGAALRRASRKP
jgi:hypothetical protein